MLLQYFTLEKVHLLAADIVAIVTDIDHNYCTRPRCHQAWVWLVWSGL